MNPDRLQKLATKGSIPILLLLLVGLWLALQLRFGTEFVENWLPDSAPSRVAFADFSAKFGNDQSLLLTWRDATLEDPRIEQATQRLEQLTAEQPDWPITNITNSRRSVESLRSRIRNTSQKEAVRRLAGHAVGEDGSSFVVISMGPYSPKQRDAIIQAAIRVAMDLGIQRDELVIAGEPYQTHIIDQYSRTSVERFVPLSVLISLLAAWLCLRNVLMTVVVMSLAGVGQLVGMSLIYSFVGQMGAILIVVPTLLFTLTLSAAVHLSHYFFDSRSRCEQHPGARAVRMGFLPCAMAAATTAFGFFSLTTSELEPVFQFGLLSAAGILLSTLVLLVLFIPASRIQQIASGTTIPKPLKPIWFVEPLLRLAENYAGRVVLIGVALLIFFAVGLTRLSSTTRFDGMFQSDHPSVESLRWIEEHVSPIESLEFIVVFPNQPESEDLIQQLSVVERLVASVKRHDMVHSAFAANSILPPIPYQQGSRATIRRSIFRRMLNADWGSLEDAQLVARDTGGTAWRLTARFKTKNDADFHRLRSELESTLRGDLESAFPNADERPTLATTGLRTVIETANLALIQDLAVSFSTAFLLITPAMIVVARSFWGGMLLMFPNLLPVVLVFGTMGWLSIPLDVASILTASVALGIAVDDTLHCAHWYLRQRRSGESSNRSIAIALRRCARPMWHTTMICMGAMLPFLFCEFLPTGKFALLMILILACAILSDLVLLPCILCSSIGSWIGRSPTPK